MRIINLAHGDLALLGTFGVFVIVDNIGWSPFAALIIVLPGAAVVGWALQRLMFDRAMQGGELAPLLATFGLSIVIQNALQEQFSADERRLHAGAIETDSIQITGQVSIGWFELITFLVAVALLVGLHLVIRRTKLGRSLRATSDDQRTAQLVGIDNRRLYGIAMALAMATVAIAGVFLGVYTTFSPSSGPLRLIFAFEAVIIGGLGSLWGTLAGGIILGVAQTVGAQLDPGWNLLAGHIAFLVVLALRPQGLFPKVQG